MRFFARYLGGAVQLCRPVMVWGVCLAFGSLVGVSAEQTEERQTEKPNPDVTKGEIASFDQFLDRNQDIDRQLTANPSLINNAQYLQQHPALQAYLNDHPNVTEEIKENPNYFMKRESSFDAREARRRGNPNPDLTKGEIASFDQFLDRNQDIDRQLTANPSLINNAQYLRSEERRV